MCWPLPAARAFGQTMNTTGEGYVPLDERSRRFFRRYGLALLILVVLGVAAAAVSLHPLDCARRHQGKLL